MRILNSLQQLGLVLGTIKKLASHTELNKVPSVSIFLLTLFH